MRDDKDLKQLAKDLLADKLFTTCHLRKGDEKLVSSIFMPLMFIDEKQRDEMEAEKVEVLFEYISEANPRSINGYPMFMTMRTMNKEEWEKVIEYHDKMKKALDEV